MPIPSDAIATIYTLEESAYHLLRYNGDTALREEAATSYMKAFRVVAERHPDTLPDFIPAYKSTLDKFLQLVENPLQPDRLRFNVVTLARATLSQIHQAAEYETLLSRLKSPVDPRLMDPFKEAVEIRRSVAKHLDFPELMERLFRIAEDRTQRGDTRQQAIIMFNETANNAVTTFGNDIRRSDFDARFVHLAATTRDKNIERAAIDFGFSGLPPRAAPGSSPA